MLRLILLAGLRKTRHRVTGHNLRQGENGPDTRYEQEALTHLVSLQKLDIDVLSRGWSGV
jgi:hypothetical protein